MSDSGKATAPARAGSAMHAWPGTLLLVLVAVCFSANHIAARFAFDYGATVNLALVLRSGVTALMMAVMLAAAGRLQLPPAPVTRRALLVGLLIALQSYCLYAAVARLPVAIALLIFNTFPLLLAILSALTRTEIAKRRTWQVMPVVLFGLALSLGVIGSGSDAADTPLSLSGIVLAFAAALLFALALMLTTRWLGSLDGRVRTGLLMLTTACVVGLVSLLQGSLTLPAQPQAWWGLLLLTLLYGSGITVVFTVLPRIGMANNAAILNMEPASALVLGWLLLDQSMRLSQALGIVLVVAAVIYLASGRNRP
ncbi:DMT family transporter [Granulosicoccaceae sp. 1_MG-2023]|nr:DMT family transporter [Granulosicoccaceae sp. 1_MG-2023]